MSKKLLNGLNEILEKILKANNISNKAEILIEEEEENSNQCIISIKENNVVILNIIVIKPEILEELEQDDKHINILSNNTENNEIEKSLFENDVVIFDEDDFKDEDEDEDDNLFENPHEIY